MILNGNHPQVPAQIEADVVIVGAGIAGIVLALELSATGLHVLLVEAGGTAFARATQDFYQASTVEPHSHGPVDMFRRRVLGGSSTVWGGRCIPFDPVDFTERDWMPHARWPIEYRDVARHYPKALEWLDAGTPEFSTDDADGGWIASGGDVVLDRIEKFSPPLDLGAHYRKRLRSTPRLTVLTNAPVSRILTYGRGAHVRGVEMAAGAGTRRIVALAEKVVLCTGGIETVRLLLSSDHDRPCGLGNEHDLVGRFYQCHLEGEVGHIRFDNPADAMAFDYRRTAGGIYCRRYLWLSPEAQRREQLAGLVLRPSHPNIVDPAHRHPVLSAMYLAKNWIVPEYARKMTSLEDIKRQSIMGDTLRARASFHSSHLRNVVAGAPQLAAFTAGFARRRTFARRKLPSVLLHDRRGIYPLDFNAEQEPNPQSRITLGAQRDALGMRRVRIDWRTTSADHERLAAGLQLMARALPSGSSMALHFNEDDLAIARERQVPVGGHHIGTVRMAHNAHEGVCDANCELFGTEGLFLAGAGVFSTSGFANPTLTLVALTLRLAAHIASLAGKVSASRASAPSRLDA